MKRKVKRGGSKCGRERDGDRKSEREGKAKRRQKKERERGGTKREKLSEKR